MEGCTTRQVRSGDAQALTDFMRIVAGDAEYMLLSPDAFTVDMAVAIDFHTNFEDMVGIVAIKGEDVVGNCLITNGEFEATRHVGHVAVSVRKDLRGYGLGRRMVEEAMSVSPCEVFVAECFAENQPSIDLFAFLGFKQVGRVPNYIYKNKQFHDKLILSK